MKSVPVACYKSKEDQAMGLADEDREEAKTRPYYWTLTHLLEKSNDPEARRELEIRFGKRPPGNDYCDDDCPCGCDGVRSRCVYSCLDKLD